MLLEVTDDTPARALRIGDIAVGDAVEQSVVFDAAMRDAFAVLARDRAPVHDDPRFARDAGFDDPIIQGLAVSTRFSRLLGMYLPGEHAILQSIELQYRRPVYADRTLVYRCVVERLLRPMRVVQLALSVSIDGREHVTGRCRCLVR
jgi:3-hydroxybutyryl-CoA dehydratase